MEECWKKISWCEDYEISNYGRVLSLKKCEKILKPHFNKKNGYNQIVLCKNSVYKSFYIHRLVAEAFIDNPDNLPQVNHKDENKTNNYYDNLEWCDAIYNNNYGNHNRKISESKKGKPGHKHTEESRKKISDSLKGHVFSEEHINNLCIAARKRVHSEEEKQRMRTMMVGRKHSEETKKKMAEARKMYWDKKKQVVI